MFRSERGSAALKRMLTVFAYRHPRVGYCQAMSYLAALLLLVFREHELRAELVEEARATKQKPQQQHPQSQQPMQQAQPQREEDAERARAAAAAALREAAAAADAAVYAHVPAGTPNPTPEEGKRSAGGERPKVCVRNHS